MVPVHQHGRERSEEAVGNLRLIHALALGLDGLHRGVRRKSTEAGHLIAYAEEGATSAENVHGMRRRGNALEHIAKRKRQMAEAVYMGDVCGATDTVRTQECTTSQGVGRAQVSS